MSLDWQTEETTEWEEPPEIRPKSRRWPWLAVILLLAGGAFVLFWMISRRAEGVTRQVESDLLASYEVIENAARQDDPELFLSFLSGQDLVWASAWQQLVAEGAYLNREAFGLTWQPAGDPGTAVPHITLNPQFNAAELVTEQAYSYDVGNGLTETVRLGHTAVFRLGRDRWLLAPPDAAFWGAERSLTGGHLSLTFPERDEAIAQRLAADLDEMLVVLCADPAFSCPPDFRLGVTFETDPAALSPRYRPVVYVAGGWLIRLATPTLAGLPQDDAAYRALLRGYGAQLVNPVLHQMHGLYASTEMPFFDAWVAWQLKRIGLRPYPLLAADWQNLAEEAAPLSAGRPLWGMSGPATPLTYALLDFLIEDVGVSPVDVSQSFSFFNGRMRTYESWLAELTGERLTPGELEARWRAYVQAQAAPARR